MPNKITIHQYIDKVGRLAVADSLGITRQCVFNWYHHVTMPRPIYANRLIKISKGLLDWEHIYKPYFRTKNETRKKKTKS